MTTAEWPLHRIGMVAGSIFLLVGSHSPIYSLTGAEYTHTINMGAHGGDGIYLAILATASLVSSFKSIYWPGYLAGGLAIFECGDILWLRVPYERRSLPHSYPSLGIDMVAVSPEWGVAVITIGGLLCLASSIVATHIYLQKRRRTTP